MGRESRREKRRFKALVRKHQRISDKIVELKASLGEGFTYDPLVAPHAENWLAVDEGERLALVRAYHKRAGLGLGTESQDNLHAAAHTIIESQIAMDVDGRREELAALMVRGMDRHEAVHELARDVMGQVHSVLKESG